MKRQSSLSKAGNKASRRVALAFALTALGAGFFACSGEFKTACPEGSTQTAGGGDVKTACTPNDQMGAAGAGGGVDGMGGAGASGSGGASGSSGSGGEGGSGGQAGGGGLGGAGGGVVPGPPGTLDTSFGKGGKAEFGTLSLTALSAFDFQSSDKIVVAGQAVFSDSTRKSLVARLDASGGFDASFGGEGKGYAIDGVNQMSNVVPFYRLLVQADDGIVGGPPQATGCTGNCRVIRFLRDGEFDPSFSTIRLDTTVVLNGLMRTPDGQGFFIVRDGYYGGSSDSLVMSKYLDNGTLTGDFPAGAPHFTYVPNINGSPKVAADPLVDPQGRVNVAFTLADNVFYGVTRLTAAGKEDHEFSSRGKHETGAGEALGLAMDASGRLLVGGHLETSAVVSRSTPIGLLDDTYGNGGFTPSVPSTRWQCVVADAGERAVVVGTYAEADSQAIRLGRYGQNGFPDVTYGVEGNGFATLVQGSEVSLSQCKLDRQGRLLVAGLVRASAGAPSEPFLMRVWN